MIVIKALLHFLCNDGGRYLRPTWQQKYFCSTISKV